MTDPRIIRHVEFVDGPASTSTGSKTDGTTANPTIRAQIEQVADWLKGLSEITPPVVEGLFVVRDALVCEAKLRHVLAVLDEQGRPE